MYLSAQEMRDRLKVIAPKLKIAKNTRDGEALFGQPACGEWYIPCVYGFIFMGLDGGLRAFSDHREIVKQLADLDDCRHTTTRFEPSGRVSGLTVSFPIERLEAMASLLQAKRKQPLTPGRRAALDAGRVKFKAVHAASELE